MATCDLYNNVKTMIVLDYDVYTTGNTVGENVDMHGFESVIFVITTGEGTDGDFTFGLGEADLDPSTGLPGAFNPVPEESLLTTFPTGAPNHGFPVLDGSDANDENQIYKVGYVGNKQFLQLVMAATNAGTGMTIGAMAVLGDPHMAPVLNA